MRNLYTDSIMSNVSPFYDYSAICSTSFNEGHEHQYPYSSSCCCCCSCNSVSSIPIRTVSSSRLVSIKPSPFYGFSQSALIKRGPSRMRMIIGSGDYYRNASYIRDLGIDWIRYQDMKSKGKGIGFGGYGTVTSVVEQRCILRKLGAACDDAEAIINLLTEESGDENISADGRMKKVSSSKKVNIRENVVDKRSKSRKAKVITEQANQELKSRGTDRYYASDYHNVKMQCRSRVGDNQATEMADSSNKYGHLRGGCSGFVDGKSTTFLRKASDSEEYVYVGSGSRRISDTHKDTSLKVQYNSGVGESVTKVYNSFDMQRSGHRVKDSRASNKYEHMTGSSGYVDENSSRYLRKVSGSEEHVISAGEASDSSYKYKHTTDSSGYLSKGSDSKKGVVSAGGFCSSCGKVTSESEARTTNEQRSQLYAETKVASRQKASSSLTAHEQHKQEHFVASSQVNLMKSEDYTVREDGAESYEENTELMSENQECTELVDSSDSNVKVLEENVVLVSSQSAKEELLQKGQKQSLKAQSGSSRVYFDGTIIEGTSSASEEMLRYKQSYLSERVKVTHEHVKETIKQTEHRYEVQTPLKEPSFSTSTSQVRIEEICEDQDKKNTSSVPPQSIEVTHEHISQRITEQVQPESVTKVNSSDMWRSGRSVKDNRASVTSDSSDKYERLTGSIGFVDEKSSSYSSKASGSEEQVNSGGETSDSSYKYKHITDSSGYLSKGSDSLASSSLIANEAREQHKQEHFVASNEVNMMISDDYTERADVADGYEENTNISRLSTVGKQFELVAGEKSHLEHLVASSQNELMSENQECTELVDSGDSNVKVLKEIVVSASSQSAKEELFKTGQKQSLKAQSGSSQVHFDGTMIEGSLSASVEMLLYEQIYLSERVKKTHEHVKETIKQTELRYDVQTPLKEPSFATSTSQGKIEEIGDEQDKRKAHEHTSQSGIVNRSGRALWNVLTFGVLNTADNVSGETNIELNVDKVSAKATRIMDKSEDDKDMSIASSQTEIMRENKECMELVDSGDSTVNILKENVVSVSSQTAKEELFQKDQKNLLKAQSGSSEVYFDGTMIEGSLNASEETLWYGQSYLTERVKETHEHVKETVEQTELQYNVQMPSTSQVKIEEIGDDQDKTNISSVPSPRLDQPHQCIEVANEHTAQSGVVKRSGKALWNALAFGVLNTGDNVSGETNVELNVDKMSSQATVSTDHLQSDAFYELQESGKNMSVNVASSSEENAAELKRGALQRSNQVMKERFGEWEEAYRLKSEQRELDQTFMREALEEAKKAADMWEVPVGAVLVQDGKIIARGHNLVEESRDSTAHAEMVCIRAASTILKTWRLSDTTLYVTLEPCAMCAGAILQSRIGALVYGAPNKLLGADGSWVRLFPTSVNGEEGSMKTEGPIHPFHPNMKIRRGILEAECGELMQQSFKLRRRNKGEKTEQRSNKKVHINPSKLLHKMHHKFHILFHL